MDAHWWHFGNLTATLAGGALAVSVIAIVVVAYGPTKNWRRGFWSWITAAFPTGVNASDRVDGTSLITFLATFGIAQVAGLLTLIREQESKKYIVLAIYVVLAVSTIASITLLIHISSVRPARRGNRGTAIPYYDRKTIGFGRLVLVWFYPLTALLFGLGLYDLLPGQTYRETYGAGRELALKPAEPITSGADLGPLLAGRELKGADGLLNNWYQWMQPPAGVRLVVCVQEPAFDKAYSSFARELLVHGPFDVADRAAFAFKNQGDATSFNPIYRELRFDVETRENGPQFTNTLRIDEPDKGERIVLLLMLKPHPGSQPSNNFDIAFGKDNK